MTFNLKFKIFKGFQRSKSGEIFEQEAMTNS